MKATRILVAEDDANIREGLIDTLMSEGYETASAKDGEEALALFRRRRFDLVLLDIMMPGRNGYDVCREIRTTDRRTPVIMLTAKGDEVDKVVGLQLGADDYVTKPFGVRELLARISAVLRRVTVAASDPAHGEQTGRFGFGNVEVDTRTYKLHAGKKQFDLTDREVRLLKFFQSHPREVLSRDRLLNEVWGIDYFGTTRTLDQHIAQLRKKVEKNAALPRTIETVHGVGYRYVSG